MTAITRRFIPAATFTIAMLAITSAANAQKKGGEAPKKATSLTWGPAPDAFPAGAKMAVEKGDPTKGGEFIVRLSFPAGYKIPPHWHPTDEHVRVRSGEFLVGMGDALDATKTKKLAAGDTGTVPAKGHHFAVTPVATEVSVRAIGPFAMTYVHPADDPRKKH
jgi:mannose-6-phosphate isomerase-like protein (cupin superfamily)